MTRSWSLAAVALFLAALPLSAADTSKLLADASAKAPMLAFLTYTIDNDPPQVAGGQALCVDANKGIFMTYAVESWMKKKSLKDASLLLSDGKTVKAELLWVDPETGLGFFKATEKGAFTAATFLRDAKFPAGTQLVSVGLLEDPNHTPYVSSAYVSAVIKTPDPMVYVTNGHLTSEGSPVLNETGEVVGLVNQQQFERYVAPTQQGGQQEVMLKNRQASSFFRPASSLATVLDCIAKNPETPRTMPWIGVLALDLPNAELAKQVNVPGIFVPKVVPGQNGDKAGLKDEDVIVALNGKAFEKTTPPNLMVQKFGRDLLTLGAGADITLTVRHKDKAKDDVQLKVHMDPVPTQPQEAARYVSQPLGFVSRDLVLIDQYNQQTPAAKSAKGVLVMFVPKQVESPAYEAGLVNGDVIVSVNDAKVEDVAGFKKLVEDAIKAGPDKEVKIVVHRGADETTQTFNIKPVRPTTAPSNK